MIKEFIDKKRVIFAEGFDSWEEAVAASCQPLIEDGSITAEYIDAIIKSVNEFGPYIVIAPNICIPHAMAGGPGVNRSAVSMMKTRYPVSFEVGNPEKDAQLFFVLAAQEADEHMENLVKLVDMLSDEEYVEKLLAINSLEDLRKIA